jgi:nucleoid DNA-binding protein
MSDDAKLAKRIKEHVRERLVTQDEFYERLNTRVFIPHLGKALDFNTIKNVVHGMGDVVTEIAHDGDSVRFGKLGTFRPHVTPPGKRWDPTTKEKFDGPERRKLAFKQSKSTKRLFLAANG